MNAVTIDQRQQDWGPHEDEQEAQRLPRRPRRQFFNRRSAALAALVTCAAGFYGGVRVEKGQLASGSTRTVAPPAGAARPGAAGAGLAGGNASFGTVNSVNGNTLVLTEASGNTVKVRLGSSTKISKSLSVARSSIRPGDAVIVSGVPNSTGTVVAASVTDSGAGRSSGSGTSSSSGSGSGSGSAVGSLFSSGGGG